VPLLDIKELARELKIGRSTAYKLTTDGVIPHVRVGGQLRYDIVEVTHALSSGNPHDGKAAAG
jgi:excisionase family DNA binding protein